MQKEPAETAAITCNAPGQHLLVDQLQEEGRHLKVLIEREQAERKEERIERKEERSAERERTERHEALVTALLGEQQELRDEIQRLRALQVPEPIEPLMAAEGQNYSIEDGKHKEAGKTPLATATSSYSFLQALEPPIEYNVSVEPTEATLRPEKITNTGDSGSAPIFGVLALVALAALAWVTIANPEFPLREAIISLWQ